MTFYADSTKLFTVVGRSADRPSSPPDKQVLFWDRELEYLYAVNDDMEWVQINDPSRLKSLRVNFSYIQQPDQLILAAPVNTRVLDLRLEIEIGFSHPISIGDSGDHERLAAESDIVYGTPGRYKIEPDHDYPSETEIKIYIDPASTTGVASLVMIYDRF